MRPSSARITRRCDPPTHALRAMSQPPFGAELSRFSRETEAVSIARSISRSELEAVLSFLSQHHPCGLCHVTIISMASAVEVALDNRDALAHKTLRSLTGLAAPLVPPPTCWSVRNPTVLLLSWCDHYWPAGTNLITVGHRIAYRLSALRHPYACTRALGIATSYSRTALAVAPSPVGYRVQRSRL
jgi:hypothetical protein